MEKLIGKNEFIRAIEKVRDVKQLNEDVWNVLDAFSKKQTDVYMDVGSFILPDCSDLVIQLLAKLVNDKNCLVEDFCYDANFGEEPFQYETNGKLFTVDSPEVLWALLREINKSPIK